MVSRKVRIVNPSGLHLRPAGVLSSRSMRFSCRIEIHDGEKTIDCKSVLNIMAAGIGRGKEVELVCDGEDEEAALSDIASAIEQGLGEKTTE